MKHILPILLTITMLTSCFPVGEQTKQAKAEENMRAFFHSLADGDYKTAVSLYNGSYQELAQMNPDLSITDDITLWKRACEQNGFVCMNVRNVVNVADKNSQFEFTITFETKDGNLFEFTGCCGETLSKPIVEYVILVQADEAGQFAVLSRPPYVP